MFLFSFNFTMSWSKKIYPVSTDGSLKKNYNRPLSLSNFDPDLFGIEYMLTGLMVQATQKVDMLFTQSVSL